jgi:FG-GAP-like repeat/FG-GAP repeat
MERAMKTPGLIWFTLSIGAFISLLCPLASSQTLTAFPGLHFRTDPFPQSVAVGDFNGDGNLDLAVSVYSFETALSDLTILLGNGNGTFKQGPRVGVAGQNVNNAVVADFNGDGIPDLAISLPDANEIQVLLGNGDGSFTPLSPVSAAAIFVIATGDFNHDGKPDLALVNPGAESVTILLGNGDGTFAEKSRIPISGAPTAIAVGDLNLDGKPDLAVVNGSTQSVTILLGKGNGTFTKLASQPATGVEPLSIAIGDFNGDGLPDLAVSNQNYGYPNLGSVTVLLGNGKGAFRSTSVSPETGSIPDKILVADFNGDGKPDLVTSNAGSNTISLLLGKGHGVFAKAQSFAAGTDPLGAALGDFNGEGIADVVVANNTTASVTVLLTKRPR